MKTHTEQIEKYLLGKLNNTEIQEFENALSSNPELKKELEAQQQIMNAVDERGLEEDIRQAAHKYKMKLRLRNWGLAIGIVLASLALLIYSLKSSTKQASILNEKGTNIIPQKGTNIIPQKSINIDAEDSTENFTEADTHLPSIHYTINNSKDTIIETPTGMFVAVEAGSFKTQNGNVIEGSVDLEIKEALAAEDIIKGGLSTTADGKLLETGGMFYINAHYNHEMVQVAKNIQVQVPTSNPKKDMMLFDGQRLENGRINWVDPKPLTKDLTTYEVPSLDFYPPKYIPKLKELGLKWQNKKYTDSLYFSFSGYKYHQFMEGYIGTSKPMIEVLDIIDSSINKKVNDSIFQARQKNKVKNTSKDFLVTNPEIDPARIAAIWNTKFNNTIIATKEFEERLHYIFSTYKPAYLDLYLNNLQLNLYEIDSLCMRMATAQEKEKFREFYEMKNGGVRVTTALQQNLNRLTAQRLQMFKQAASEAWKAYYKKEANLDTIAMKAENKFFTKEANRMVETFQQEFCINLVNAYQQIGQKKECPIKFVSDGRNYTNAYYKTSFSNFGWKNLDRYVSDATINRTTLDYTDPATGRRAIIRYEPVTIHIADEQKYTRVLTYMIPDSLCSFQRIYKDGDVYTEKLNELIHYDLLAIGYIDDKIYVYKQEHAKPGDYTFNLTKSSEADLTKLLHTASKRKIQDIKEDVAFQQFAIKENKRRQARLALNEMRWEIANVLFILPPRPNLDE